MVLIVCNTLLCTLYIFAFESHKSPVWWANKCVQWTDIMMLPLTDRTLFGLQSQETKQTSPSQYAVEPELKINSQLKSNTHQNDDMFLFHFKLWLS